MQEYDMNRYMTIKKKLANLRGQFLRDNDRLNNSKKSGCGTDEVFQSTWKWYKRLEFFKSGEIVVNSNVETIDLATPTTKHQKLTEKLTEKMVVLDKSMEILNSKPEERTEADENIFGKMIVVTLKRMNLYLKIIARKKTNDILFEIELSDYKQQQSYPMNEHFRGPINTSNTSNLISQNPYSAPQATYGKTSFPVSSPDSESELF